MFISNERQNPSVLVELELTLSDCVRMVCMLSAAAGLPRGERTRGGARRETVRFPLSRALRVWRCRLAHRARPDLGAGDILLLLCPKGQGGEMKTVIERTDPLVAPLAAGQRVGTIKVTTAAGATISRRFGSSATRYRSSLRTMKRGAAGC